MVFVEFTVSSPPHDGEKLYFVGASFASVFNDTKLGTSFAGLNFSSYRIIKEEKVRALGLGFLEEGIMSVRRGRSKSFLLGFPRNRRRATLTN